LANKTVEELGLGTKEVLSITNDKKVIEAFQQMIEKRVSGLGVIDGENHLIGQISSSDIKEISPNAGLFKKIYLPIGDFCWRFHKSLLVICCTFKDSLSSIVKKIIENKIHRIFIVEDFESRKLSGIISLGDILRLFVKE